MNIKYSIGIGLVAFAFVATAGVAVATSHIDKLDSFTQSELDTNWEGDRRFPTGGASSTSVFGRDDVARIGIDSAETSTSGFTRTEGIKTVGDNNFGDTIEIDLYIDPAWEDTATRAGLWVVGDDGTGERDNLFGIIEFINSEECPDCTSHPSHTINHEGFRIWDSTVGWTENLDTEFTYGEWVTLGIELATSTNQYTYYIDGEEVGTATGGDHFIREVFLNSYNYGLDETFVFLDNDSYDAHWHLGIGDPAEKGDCKDGGWENFGFKNQGQCIKLINTDKDSR